MYEWKSESIDQIAAALSKAQASIQPAVKDRNNPAFKSKYADLAGVWEAMGSALTDNGLALAQLPFPAENGFVLRSVLMHKSGQWLLSDLFMAPDMTSAQKVGGAITYARRYAASAIVGVYQDDDDGETAVGRGNGHAYQGGGHRTQQPAPAPSAAKPPYDPAADARPIGQFVADAAAKIFVPAATLNKDVVRLAVSEGYAPEVPLTSDQVADLVSHLDSTRKAWVRRTVLEIVKAKLAEKNAA